MATSSAGQPRPWIFPPIGESAAVAGARCAAAGACCTATEASHQHLVAQTAAAYGEGGAGSPRWRRPAGVHARRERTPPRHQQEAAPVSVDD
jgi:hypothetical protein